MPAAADAMSMIVLLVAVALTALTAGVANAQQTFDFDWTSITNVGMFPGDPTAAPTAAADRILRGRGTLTLLANPIPGMAFAFDFRGPEGSGSGLVLPDRRTLDPNFAFPTASTAAPPAGETLRVWTGFRLFGPATQPSAIEVHFIEVFVCRGAPERCGGIRHMERFFIGIGRRAPPSP